MAKRVIPRALFDPLESITASELLQNEALIGLIKEETFPAIEEAFENKKTFATLFEINTTGYYIDVPKTGWVSALEECIKFNLGEEKFEECIKIKDLIEKIKQPTKTLPKKTKDGATGVHGDTASN